MLIAIAVLIITCPCALGLAVPVVQVVAAGRLFQNGVMVKDGSAMERLAEIDSVVFDKTGTLTLGRPQLVETVGPPARIVMAAAIAAHSRHPLSQSIYNAYPGPVASLGAVTEIAGDGLLAKMPEGEYRLGKRAFACPGSVSPERGGSEVVLSLDTVEIARFHLEDRLRPDAETAIETLQQKGFETRVLSGDRQPVVAAMAARLGIDAFEAELSPGGKTKAIEALQGAGRRVLMVGDGINDAPALSAAHVSMAPATAADIGRQAADFVFMHDSLEAVPMAIRISAKAGRLIRENFALAIGYNIIAVPIAIAGYATPLIAAIAMSTSSLIVVANSLRLNDVRRTKVKSPEVDRVSAGRLPGKASLA